MAYFTIYECKESPFPGNVDFETMKVFWDALAEAKKQTMEFGRDPTKRYYHTTDHKELLWWFGKNGWSDIIFLEPTVPVMRVNSMFRHIIKDARESVKAAHGTRENTATVIAVLVLRPYEICRNRIKRWMKRTLKRALLRVGILWGRHLLKEEDEVPLIVPYIPLTEQHLTMLAADPMYFPNDELERHKQVILANYTQSTIQRERTPPSVA